MPTRLCGMSDGMNSTPTAVVAMVATMYGRRGGESGVTAIPRSARVTDYLESGAGHGVLVGVGRRVRVDHDPCHPTRPIGRATTTVWGHLLSWLALYSSGWVGRHTCNSLIKLEIQMEIC